jgi:hypothetical protein
MKILTALLSLLLTLTSSVWSQDQGFVEKHPKVIEMEIMLTKEASTFLQRRIPTEQFYVNVDVTPLRRVQAGKDEQLPYFYSEDEVGDEWDAIDTPLVLLLSRIKKATIKVEVPDHLSDTEIGDLREKLYEQLKLISGRDTINIERKVMAISKPANLNNDYSLYYFITGIALVIFFGLFLSIKHSTKNATGASSAATNSPPAQATPSMPMRSSSSASLKMNSGSMTTNSKVNGDINFKDSIRAADALREKLHGVVNAPVFPLLSDMLILEELSEKSLSSFGAFVFEMPRKHQQKIFFRGRSDKWFKGYVEASSVDMDCFLAVEKMLRSRHVAGSEKWEELLVQVWRLADEAYLFLKQIPADEAFNLLAHLPKSFAVPAAKRSYPGGWARVLEPIDYKPIDDEAKVEDYLQRTLQLKPYFSFKSIDEYKRVLELVDYLRATNIKDEEEIYESLSFDSPIFNIRPPFYVIFKAEHEDFKFIHDQFQMEDWAIALFNSPRDYMKKVTNELDDKRRYIFSMVLKQLDENHPTQIEQSDLREEIAKVFKTYMTNKKMHKAEISEQKGSEVNEKDLPAAA